MSLKEIKKLRKFFKITDDVTGAVQVSEFFIPVISTLKS